MTGRTHMSSTGGKRWLPLALPLLLMLLFTTTITLASGQQCNHYTKDAFLDRLERHLTFCLGDDVALHNAAWEQLNDRFTANEFDRQHPLALMLFSNSTQLLTTIASAITTALFGTNPSSHVHQVLDFQQLLPEEPSYSTNHDVKQTIRAALGSSLRACPQRTVFIMENVQVVQDATLPVLDVFLDPLNGKRAQFQEHIDGAASTLLDCSHSIFLFMFHTTMPFTVDSPSSWREFLMDKWTRRDGGMLEEFTPQALVGRLTDGLTFFLSPSNDAPNGNAQETRKEQSAQWQEMCRLNTNSAVDEGAIHGDDMNLPVNTLQLTKIFMGFLFVLAILNRTKDWNQQTAMKHQERGRIRKHKSKRKNTRDDKRRRRRKHP